MVEQASSFFDAASAARDLDVDRGLLLETRPADLRSSSSHEVASQGSFRSTASPRAMRLGGLYCYVWYVSCSLGNGRFEARIAQIFFAGLCPAPRWG